MLTATYTLVALSVEQASVRVSVQSFQHYVQANLRHQNSISLAQLQYACDCLSRLYQACHWRKIEMYLIPAIRHATQEADRLLDELSALNNAALDIVRAVQERTGTMTAHTDEQVGQLCSSMDAFCTALLEQLEKEERELFSLARSVICGDAWFAIANQFLLHDARVEDKRRNKAPVIALPLAVADVSAFDVEDEPSPAMFNARRESGQKAWLGK
ncbi:hemerythrin-like domain-containing protein [Oxalobacteraceae bacterium GrIS 1.11]